MKKILILCAVLVSLSSCGGGGGGGTSSTSTAPSVNSLANICTPVGEKKWVRAHLDDIYLWYNEIVDVVPTSYSTVADYFYALLVPSKDRFSFTASQAEIDSFYESGVEIGYGANFVRVGDRLVVSYSEANSPAALQNVTRGVEIVGINGVLRSQLDDATRIAALYPSVEGATNQFDVLDVGATATRRVQLTAVAVTRSPVYKTSVIATADNKKVGYMVFNDHISTAEDPLIAAMTQFQQAGISDLVLDVRYNGGGFIYIASEVGSMIGGTAVSNKVFEKFTFNAKHPERTNDPHNSLPFYANSSSNQPLPQLNLRRVFVLTGPGTCSASESIINSLSPFVQVIRIGGTTCGKPYGFIQTNNCSQAYFAIQFEGVNDLGQGGYVDGFSPTCAVSDDLEHALGDTSERLLSSALGYRTSGSCPAVASTKSLTAKYAPLVAKEVYRAPWRDRRILK